MKLTVDISLTPSCTGNNSPQLLRLALLLMLDTRNNTDGDKLVIFSGMALYYGDTNIVITSGTLIT